jgi:signal transduction histidine kinase
MLTHEIKNPLTSIRFAIGSLANNSQPDAPNSQRRLDNITRSVQSIDEIIERCNLANGLDEQSIEPLLETLDVADLVQSLIDTSDHKSRFVVTLNATPTLAPPINAFLVPYFACAYVKPVTAPTIPIGNADTPPNANVTPRIPNNLALASLAPGSPLPHSRAFRSKKYTIC